MVIQDADCFAYIGEGLGKKQLKVCGGGMCVKKTKKKRKYTEKEIEKEYVQLYGDFKIMKVFMV